MMLHSVIDISFGYIFNPGKRRSQSKSILCPPIEDPSADAFELLLVEVNRIMRDHFSAFTSAGNFPSAIAARYLRADKGCLAQRHHFDYKEDKYDVCLSVILALEPGTRFEFCSKVGGTYVRSISDIPPLSMIVFNGSVAHGGAAYDKDNIRVF